MRLCIFEDRGVEALEPIALTRPAFELRCGSRNLLERQRRHFGDPETGAWIRPRLVDFARASSGPSLPINDAAWMRQESVVFVNARWLAPLDLLADRITPRVGLVSDQVAYVIAPAIEAADLRDGVDGFVQRCRVRMPSCDGGGAMLDFLWDFVERNGEALCEEKGLFRASCAVQTELPAHLTVIGPAADLVVAEDATIEPHVLLDTRQGPILVDRGARVDAFSRIEGPCYIGPDTWVLGVRLLAGTTLGPCCRIGGEVQRSIVQGFSNKGHDGFLGHSYVGEWVNLAAGTQTSDLRNDYGEVRLSVDGQRLATGHTKVGSFLGDHTKTGIGALLNTGSVVGAFCNLLPSGSLLPQVVPSFCQVRDGELHDRWDLRHLFATATRAMARRRFEFTPGHAEFFDDLYGLTAERRRELISDTAARRKKRMV